MTKEILKKAFEFLRSTGNVHTQKDLANAMNYNVASISRAFRETNVTSRKTS